MNKESLTISEVNELRKELESKGVTISKPIIEIPEGVYSGKFVTQKRDAKTLEPVISCISYTRNDKPMAFFAAKANISNEEKSYSNVNIGLSDELEELLSNSDTLVRPYAFRSKKGTVRTFVAVEL